MHRIILGQRVVVARPADTRPPTPAPDILERRAASLDEARAMAGFPLYQPTFGHTDGLALAGVELLLLPAPDGPQVAQVVSRFHGAPGQWLILRQCSPVGADPSAPEIGIPHALRQGRVGGVPAASFAHPVAAAMQPGGALVVTHYLWERDGCLLELQAPHLTAAALARIGASLR